MKLKSKLSQIGQCHMTTAKIQDIMPLSSQGDCGCGQTKTFRQKIHVQAMLKTEQHTGTKKTQGPKKYTKHNDARDCKRKTAGLRSICNRSNVNRRQFFRLWSLASLVFVKGGEPVNPEKNTGSKARTNNKLDLHVTPGQNPARATQNGGCKAAFGTLIENFYSTAISLCVSETLTVVVIVPVSLVFHFYMFYVR